jgi:hypothetical protein
MINIGEEKGEQDGLQVFCHNWRDGSEWINVESLYRYARATVQPSTPPGLTKSIYFISPDYQEGPTVDQCCVFRDE